MWRDWSPLLLLASQVQAPSERNSLLAKSVIFTYSDWDWSGKTPGWVPFIIHIPQKAFAYCLCSCREGKREWLIAGRVRGKHQTVWSQSLEAPSTKGKLSPTHSTSIKGDAPASGKTSFQDLQRKYDTG